VWSLLARLLFRAAERRRSNYRTLPLGREEGEEEKGGKSKFFPFSRPLLPLAGGQFRVSGG